MTRSLALLLLAFVLDTSAGSRIYRCERADAITFQEHPCGADDEPVVLEEQSFGEPEADAVGAPTSGDRPKSGVRRRTSIATKNRPEKSKARSPACLAATKQRDDAYATRGNTMTFDERRALQDRLDAACGLR